MILNLLIADIPVPIKKQDGDFCNSSGIAEVSIKYTTGISSKRDRRSGLF